MTPLTEVQDALLGLTDDVSMDEPARAVIKEWLYSDHVAALLFRSRLDDGCGPVAPEVQEQLTFMSRQAELLDEQGHDVSANVMRDCMKVLARTMKERDQQTRFKYAANLRADRAEAILSQSGDSQGG